MNGLRNYQVEGQIGLEASFEIYLEKILKITAELKRVLKKTGQFWLNIGDCYGGLPAGNKFISEANIGEDGLYVRKMKQCGGAKSFVSGFDKENYGGLGEKRIDTTIQGRGRRENQASKCLLMQPERLAIKMIDEQGWLLRNKIIWAKQVLIKKQNKTIGSVMPTSVKDRFNESWEYLYFFVKSKKYYSDLDGVRIPNQVLGITDFRAEGFVRSAELYYNSKYRNAEGQGKINGASRISKYAKGSEYEQKYGEPWDRFGKNTQKYQQNQDPRGDDKGGPGSYRLWKDKHPYQGKFTDKEDVETFGSPRAREERKRDKTLIDPNVKGLRQSPEPKEPNAFHPLGKNIPTCWQINPDPHNFKRELGVDVDHFACFPEQLCEVPIKFGCPPKTGIVLDPFAGSGTSLVVAKRLGRNYVGIELNPDYIKIAQARLNTISNPLF